MEMIIVWIGVGLICLVVFLAVVAFILDYLDRHEKRRFWRKG